MKPWMIYGILGLVLVGVLAVVGLNVWWSLRGPDLDLPLDLGTGAPVDVLTWEGDGPLRCGGNQRVVAAMKTIRLSGETAVSAGGNCQVELVACNIRAQIAVEVRGNANVVVRGGELRGTRNAIDLGGGNIEVNDARLRGTVAIEASRGHAVLNRTSIHGRTKSIRVRSPAASVQVNQGEIQGDVDDRHGRVQITP